MGPAREQIANPELAWSYSRTRLDGAELARLAAFTERLVSQSDAALMIPLRLRELHGLELSFIAPFSPDRAGLVARLASDLMLEWEQRARAAAQTAVTGHRQLADAAELAVGLHQDAARGLDPPPVPGRGPDPGPEPPRLENEYVYRQRYVGLAGYLTSVQPGTPEDPVTAPVLPSELGAVEACYPPLSRSGALGRLTRQLLDDWRSRAAFLAGAGYPGLHPDAAAFVIPALRVTARRAAAELEWQRWQAAAGQPDPGDLASY